MKPSKEAQGALLQKYYSCCVEYFNNVCDRTYKAVVEAEHACKEARISYGEINRQRFNAFRSVEMNNGSAAAN